MLNVPHSYYQNTHICTAGENKNFVIRMTLPSEVMFINFLKKWTSCSHVTWRINKTDPKNMSAGQKNIFWRKYRCQSSNDRVRQATKTPSKKHTFCPAQFTVIIKKVPKRCR